MILLCATSRITFWKVCVGGALIRGGFRYGPSSPCYRARVPIFSAFWYSVDDGIEFELQLKKYGSQVLHVLSGERFCSQLNLQDPTNSTFCGLALEFDDNELYPRAIMYFPFAVR